MNKWIIGIGVFIMIIISYFIFNQNKVEKNVPNIINNVNDSKTNTKMSKARIKTSKGDIVIEFNTTAPKTVENFQTLAGKEYYDGVRFHRVIRDFMIQAGDPLTRESLSRHMWGTGGPGYKFADELSGNEKYTLGTVAMANSGPNTNGSQFFIVSAADSKLPASYTVFAKVISGLEVVEAIQSVKTSGRMSNQPSDMPLEDVLIEKVTLEN